MVAELISVGTEILMGQVVNTDAQFMLERLAPMGIEVYHQVTVGDNPGRLEAAIVQALSRADIVILSGGLGPTGDDLTKNIVAKTFELKMERDEGALKTLEERFMRMNREMTPNNLQQADFPRGSILLANPNGTAQGCIVTKDDKAAILLPGPPKELFPMFENEVMPYLEERSGFKLYSHELRIFGLGESSAEYMVRDIMEEQDNPTIAPYAKTGEVTFRITAKCRSEEEGEELCAPMVAKVSSRLGDVVYSVNGEALNAVCLNELKKRNATIAVAESCTGGLLCSAFVDIPGSSDCFIEGAVTYSNTAKQVRLNVSEKTLNDLGAVSAQCAKEMAEGLRMISGADYAIATTGVAGPAGGTIEKPVGLVYVALADEKGTITKELRLTGRRDIIRERTVLHALDLLRRRLLGLNIE